MTNVDIRKRLDPLIKKLAKEKSLDVAEEVVGSVLELLNLRLQIHLNLKSLEILVKIGTERVGW